MFPGQGSQRKGMGDGLFERYPALVAQADAALGWSLRELCMEDPKGVIGQTRYTQPALFAVSSLSFLAMRDGGARLPDFYAGHSLGEFTALFAAGAFDFATGVALVAKRGELMSHAPRGAMAAVIGLGVDRIREVLDSAGMDGVDLANINSGDQIVISGLYDDIDRCRTVFADVGARFVRLNVSAAFHSRHMREIESQFAVFARELETEGRLYPLTADVMSNRTARPHARNDYLPALVEQITHPVRWHESISWLLAQGEVTAEEIGPGDVLTGLFARIRKAPLPIVADAENMRLPASRADKRRTVFMYSGQGSQYYGMGREVYAKNAAFRDAMDACNAIFRNETGRDMVAELYDDANRWREMNDIVLSHPALYSIGFGLTAAMRDAGIHPDCVLGYSLGEYAASTVAGAISHEDAMRTVVRQALALKSSGVAGGMLSVMAPVEDFERRPEIYRDTVVASINFDGNFVISGGIDALEAASRRLGAEAIAHVRLPVEYPFHSPLIRRLEDAFLGLFEGVTLQASSMPQYSATSGGRIVQPDAAHYWNVTISPVDFRSAVSRIAEERPCRFVDLGPTGALSGFLKHGFGERLEHLTTIDQFGRNMQTVADTVGRLAA